MLFKIKRFKILHESFDLIHSVFEEMIEVKSILTTKGICRVKKLSEQKGSKSTHFLAENVGILFWRDYETSGRKYQMESG